MRERVAAGGAIVVALCLVAWASLGGPSGLRLAYAGLDNELDAWAALLEELGHPVQIVDRPPSGARLDPAVTIVIPDVAGVRGEEREELGEFLAEGGRLVLSGIEAEAIADVAGFDIGDAPPLRGRPGAAHPVAPAPELAGVHAVELGGRALADLGDALPILSSSTGTVAAVATVGQGRLVLLVDASPFRRDRLTRADNAAFALAVAGDPGRPVRFVTGRGETASASREGLAAVPSSWWLFAFGLLLAGLVAIAARWRRLGPPEGAARPLAPPRHDYVEAMAAHLARTRDPGTVAEPLRAEARAILERWAGIGRDAGPERIREAARSRGLEPDEADSVALPPQDEPGLMAAAAAMVKLGAPVGSPVSGTSQRIEGDR